MLIIKETGKKESQGIFRKYLPPLSLRDISPKGGEYLK
jgi:hypothetical protein